MSLYRAKGKSQSIAWVVWGATAFFYFFELFVRVMPGTMLQTMQSHYGVSSATFGMASGVYCYIYGPMQIFAGILLDRFGGRHIMLPAAIIVSVGCACILAPWNSVWLFVISRLLMGFGSAFGFIGVMYLATVWFRKERLSFVSGLTTAIGFLGPILALKWIPHFVGHHAWQDCWFGASVFGVFSFIILYVCVPLTPIWEKQRRKAHLEGLTSNHAFSGFFTVIRNKQTWFLGLIGGILYMPTTVFGDLWGKEYVRTVHHISNEEAGVVVSMIYLGWLIGAPFWGYFSDRTDQKRSLLFFSTLSAAVLLFVLISWNSMSISFLKACLFLTGFVSAPQVICFALGVEKNAENAKASAIAAINMFVTLVGGILQPVVGWLLDLLGNNLTGSAFHCYCASDFQWALLVMPIVTLIGFFLVFGLHRESKVKSRK
jgi:MFS family permease